MIRARYEKFRLFDADNPQVFTLFEKYALEAKASGRPRFGARMIGERIRWYTMVETTDPIYKINNDHWPYYARILELRDPTVFKGFFRCRIARSDVDNLTLILDYCQ